MALVVEDRPRAGSPGFCALDGMPLHVTIVGLRCPLCGPVAPLPRPGHDRPAA